MKTKTNTTESSAKSESVGVREKRLRLLDALEINGFNLSESARQVGYTEGYIKNGELSKSLKRDLWFQSELERRRSINLSNNLDRIKALDNLVAHLIDTGEYKGQKISPNVLKGFIELSYRRMGALQTHNLDSPANDVRKLTEDEQKQAQEASMQLLRKKAG